VRRVQPGHNPFEEVTEMLSLEIIGVLGALLALVTSVMVRTQLHSRGLAVHGEEPRGAKA
jgi:hypothetical protein